MEQKEKTRTKHILQRARDFAGAAVMVASLAGCGAAQRPPEQIEVKRTTIERISTSRVAPSRRVGDSELEHLRQQMPATPERAGDCNVPSNPRVGDVIPECLRTIVVINANVPYDQNFRNRLAEVQRRYDYMRIYPELDYSVQSGVRNVKNIHVSTTLYGSGDTMMDEWFNYIVTGVRPTSPPGWNDP